MNLDQFDKSILIDVLRHGNIDFDVLDAIEDVKRKKVNEIHHYTITPPSGKNGRWQTYLTDPEKGRKKISALSEQKLYEKLYDHYYANEVLSIKGLFPLWIERRRRDNLSDRSVHRYRNYWDKYYAKHPIAKKRVDKVTFEEIEDFIHEMIAKHDMTLKEVNNMKIPLVGIMKLAKRKKYITYNPFNDVEIQTYSCRPPNKKTKSKKVFYPTEKKKLFKALNEYIICTPEETKVYAVFLLFKLGLRIGEIVALRESDIDYGTMEIHIHRMETVADNEDGNLRPIVVNHTKKKSVYGNRYLKITDYELDIIDLVMEKNEMYGYQEEDFIFCDSDGRTNIRRLGLFINKMCRIAAIPNKTSHDIRRTVASEMYNNGVPVEIIREYLGHSTTDVTYGYIFDNMEDEETAKVITTSLNGMNGLKGTHRKRAKKMPKAL